MKFHYTARTKSGELQAGYVEGVTKESASQVLGSHGLYILSLEPLRSTFSRLFVSFIKRVKKTDVMVFTRQLSTMLEAGIALGDALKSLYNQIRNPVLREAVLEISLDVDSGLSLSQAMERQSAIFNDFYISLIRTAEVTGRIDEAMSFLADHLEKELTLIAKVRNALIYPALVIALFLVVVFILLTVVFPQIAPIFEEANVELPFITKSLLGIGTFLASWWIVIVLLTAIFIGIIFDYFRSREGKSVLDQVLLHLPVFGGIFRKLYVVRFSSNMSILLKGGIPISQAIEITSHNIQSALYEDALNHAAQGVSQGELLSATLLSYPDYFPNLVVQMTSVGEATGRLGDMLDRVSSFYTREVDALVGELVELIQPVIMIVIGVMVGLLFAALLLPIFDLAQQGF
jgi:type IV pilus assembly protein PilC